MCTREFRGADLNSLSPMDVARLLQVRGPTGRNNLGAKPCRTDRGGSRCGGFSDNRWSLWPWFAFGSEIPISRASMLRRRNWQTGAAKENVPVVVSNFIIAALRGAILTAGFLVTPDVLAMIDGQRRRHKWCFFTPKPTCAVACPCHHRRGISDVFGKLGNAAHAIP